MGAIPEETMEVVALLGECRMERVAMRKFYHGYLGDKEVVVVFSRWGKVAAAVTVSILIEKYHITKLIFTGSAGAIDPRLQVGDVVVGSRLVQHDFDGRPLYGRFVVPYLNLTYFESPVADVQTACRAIKKFLQPQSLVVAVGSEALQEFHITTATCYAGDIASGDQFIGNDEQKQQLAASLPGLLCAEMEGAAVAQACYEYGIPFLVIRYISDSANGEASIDFSAFIKKVAGQYSRGIVSRLLPLL